RDIARRTRARVAVGGHLARLRRVVAAATGLQRRHDRCADPDADRYDEPGQLTTTAQAEHAESDKADQDESARAGPLTGRAATAGRAGLTVERCDQRDRHVPDLVLGKHRDLAVDGEVLPDR